MAMHEPWRDEASLQASDDSWHRGWFYRAVAPDRELPVLAVAAPFVGRWFADVVQTASLRDARMQPATFGLVILHRTLGGLPTLPAAMSAMHALLRPDGIAVVAGHNALRRHVGGRGDAPRSTALGYLRCAHAAGFADGRVYAARPDLDAMSLVVALDRASAVRFFRTEFAARRAAGRIRPAWLDGWYARAAPWLEPFYVTVARKC
jgi:hypothetical protein